MKHWGKEERDAAVSQLGDQEFDLLIIGGGITGAGILLDAVTRGLNVLLIEQSDFASGTSSRSTKLIHGGLRYLKQLEIKIVRETGQERAIAYKNAPHLVLPEKMILPIQQGGTYGKFMTSIALKAYDWLAGVKGNDKRKMLSKEATLNEEPLLKPDLLKGSGFYSEYRTDDARLTLEIIKTGVEKGGVAINYLRAASLIYDQTGNIKGAKLEDRLGGEKLEVRAKQVINAAGPWSDEIREMDKSMVNKRLHLTKGVHIVFDHDRLPLQHSVYFDVSDGRMVFAIPRGKSTYVGTTDTNYSDQKENPAVTLKDVNYLLAAANNMFPKLALKLEDVKSSWAGLRPLIHEDGKSPSELSRKDEVFLSYTGLITIAGGKLTGYRLMAKKVVDEVCDRLKIDQTCTTDTIQINGFPEKGLRSQLLTEWDDATADYLIHRYGQQSLEIVSKVKQEGSSLIEAEARFAMQHEMCLNLLDFYVRRTGRMYFDIDAVKATKEKIGQLFADHYGWEDSKLKQELLTLEEEITKRSTFD